MTEEYFPRGGKKPNVTYFKQSSNFLGAAEKGQGKKKKQKKRPENDDGYLSDEAVKEVDQSYKMCAASIGYKTLKPGLNLLGRVCKVLDTKLRIAMPSKTEGNVMACHISEPYNKILEAYVNDETEKVRELPEMFSLGQYVAVQVLEADGGSEGVMLSMMPQHVNSGRTHSDLLKGDILQAAVSSVEDHGYVMDIGISNTRAFLPKAESNPEIELDTGMLIWTSVKSVTTSADNSIVSLSATPAALQKALRRKKPANLEKCLLPGTAVEFTVDKPLDNGIEGRVLDATAYVQRFHADRSKDKKPALGQKIRAHVLYVMPTRNAPYLTTRNIFESARPNLEEEIKLKDGDIVEEAQVLKIAGRSIHFKLGKKCVGTMSLRRVAVHEDLSDEQVVAQSYPIGSTHRVRVITYNLSDYIYHVTDETKLLTEKYFCHSQLSVGQLVTGAVRTVADNHVTVTVGRLSGYVPQLHLSDAGVYVDPKKATTSKLTKKKYKVGQEVNARVLSVDAAKQTLMLSLKPSLVAAGAALLTSYEAAQVGKAYTGVIKVVKDFVLVSFLNEVVAYVPRNQVSRTPVANLTQAFHPGQVVTCTVLQVDAQNKKMLGSLTIEPFWPAKRSPINVKRKNETENHEVPNKKRKSSESEDTDTNTVKKKKDKKSKAKEVSEDSDAEDAEPKKKNKDKKNKKEKKVKEVSEESDAIETDIHEDSDQVLKPEDLALIDLSDCETARQWKKRVISLMKSIKCRVLRIKRIDKKIVKIEEQGLSAKNKKFHTAMHQEKLVIEERIKKLMEAMKTAQEKLKEFDEEEYRDPNYKEKQKKKKEGKNPNKEDDSSEEEAVPEKKSKKKDKLKEKEADKPKEETKGKKRKQDKNKEVKEVVDKSKEIKVVESLEPALEVPSAKDFWAESDNQASKVEESSSSSEDEEAEQPKKKRKKLTAAEKVAKARAEEEHLRELERRAVESEAQPRSSDQFERALLANPNCSQLWIAYMAFHLQATEIDKARAVGRKALNTISFREEDEKLNVWLAMLNVENRFGTKESQQKTLEEALQMNDTFKVHSKLLDIYVDTSKHQELSSLVDLMLRKYKRNPTNYIQCGAACFKLGLVDKARHVMQKAVSVLEKKEHVTVLVQFALLERTHGERERAEALFEQVLAVYPQRLDVCAAYADMLAKDRDIQAVRQVMERMTSQKLPARKMKTLFNKWSELEERIGDADRAEQVRERAVKFMETAKF
ncbi:protein RRP5 homolog isoform X2 [Leguminivora glycinivorella]|uniref:protein RRP5 homolog isoform X1 n=1 Tax=Leguminivora glycinivorella TaxID=1035111 RepID=UPI00200CBF8B|nr:protein RRP5 homolog isoform X1 [Leguminivora glycinivorella]XP_047994065.1 protein RRP5 homolog isoform X2 [Leguminivora glycinivorella]